MRVLTIIPFVRVLIVRVLTAVASPVERGLSSCDT